MADAPIAYMARTRAYYAALGYAPPYRWAQFDQVPFAPLRAPINQTKLALVTTAAPFKPDAGPQGPGAPYNAAAKFYSVYEMASDTMPDLRISHVAIDRDHTSAEDIGSYFPLAAAWRAAARCEIDLAEVFFGLPTNRSHQGSEADAQELVTRAQAQGIGAAILVANCPVCHQSVSLAARALEAAGVATVILGCARDIVEHVGVARFLFSDFPLGNAAGRPNDPAAQDETFALALAVLDQAQSARTTWVSPLRWPGPADWKQDYANPAKLSAQEIARRRADFDAGKQVAKGLRADQAKR